MFVLQPDCRVREDDVGTPVARKVIDRIVQRGPVADFWVSDEPALDFAIAKVAWGNVDQRRVDADNSRPNIFREKRDELLQWIGFTPGRGNHDLDMTKIGLAKQGLE